MSTFLPPDVQAGLDAARKKAWKQNHRLRVQVGDQVYRVLKAWDDGFVLDRGVAPHLRGRVALFDGPRLLSHCLIIASEEDGDTMRFEYKHISDANETQPVDFVRAPDAPVALIESS